MAHQPAIPTYSFRESGRTPIKLVAFAASWAFLVFVLVQGAPWWVLPPLVFAVLAMTCLTMRNPVHGIDLTDTNLIIVSPPGGSSVPLADIDHVVMEQWSDSTDVTIHLGDGSTMRLFSGDQPPYADLRRELERRGVSVK